MPKPIVSAAAAPGRRSADPASKPVLQSQAQRLLECASEGRAGPAGPGDSGSWGSSALKAEPPVPCYLLNYRGADSQPERNVILVSQPEKTSELPAAAIATAGKKPSSLLLFAAQRGWGGQRSLSIPGAPGQPVSAPGGTGSGLGG